ncbi:ribonuclease D [Phormidium pseudopriestleyi FRX01]|uniref:Ribonuclease D n=1 Tax=Phormidium pseudopriestleyi FRX01 TaxID=1759528 RepID=A0ABS3FXF2_9CYAN|nr:ribonuclease D [Phormidium pseudopriestleyi]MBO0351790.1 ribonuclease D [Phormidium pseudopriestleyi FRX01]
MPYLTDPTDIKDAIATCTQVKRLWVDTEVADYKTKNPRLSLIQILPEFPGDFPNSLELFMNRVYLLDVLDRPELTREFINAIMSEPAIEKVFHNASYDLRFLGKYQAKNVTCTLALVKRLPLFMVETSNFQLKTLACELCGLPRPDSSEQQSDWGIRPLSENQIRYATLDPIYLAYVHRRLMEIEGMTQRDPATDNVKVLAAEYLRLKQEVALLESELSYVEHRLKSAMQAQRISQMHRVKFSSYARSTYKTPFSELAKLVQEEQLDFDFVLTLTKDMRAQLDAVSDRLPMSVETSETLQLKVIKPEDE